MSKRSLNRRQGYIIAIGGAENKNRKPQILKRFTDLCARGEGHIAIIPTASELEQTGTEYQKVFHRLGAKRTDILNIKRRIDCESPSILKMISTVDGVFITGGDQSRLAEVMSGTSLIEAMKQENLHGLHITGTSAGAAFISKTMIASGKSGITPLLGMVEISKGSGLSDELIIDQHFRQRHRLGRLMTAVAQNPEKIGVGLDEDTAIFINQENKFQVAGSGWVTVVDPAAFEQCQINSSSRKQKLSVAGLKLHLLTSGDQFDVETRQVELC